MTTLTLLIKITDQDQVKKISSALNFSFKALEVEATILGKVADKWVQIALTGEDEEIATNYLIKEIGVCPGNFDNVKKFSTLKGYVKNIGKNGEDLLIDVGVFQPKIVHATINLRRLQAQLVDGRKISSRKIAELFGLCEYLPISTKVINLNEEECHIDAELSSKQITKYVLWRESLLDRLLVLGPTLHEVEVMIEHAYLERDVIGVEPLGLFEHALTCKLGTDAAGLIPKIGRNLKNAKFAVFNPKALRDFLKV